MLKKGNIVIITFSETETTLLQKQQLLYNLYLIRNYLAPNNGLIFRFSPNSEKMVNFQQVGLLNVVTERKSNDDRQT